MIQLATLYNDYIDWPKLPEQINELRIQFLPTKVGRNKLQPRNCGITFQGFFTPKYVEMFCEETERYLRKNVYAISRSLSGYVSTINWPRVKIKFSDKLFNFISELCCMLAKNFTGFMR